MVIVMVIVTLNSDIASAKRGCMVHGVHVCVGKAVAPRRLALRETSGFTSWMALNSGFKVVVFHKGVWFFPLPSNVRRPRLVRERGPGQSTQRTAGGSASKWRQTPSGKPGSKVQDSSKGGAAETGCSDLHDVRY